MNDDNARRHHDEFEDDASRRAELAQDADLTDRICATCRGSANPAALAWLAESLGVDQSTRVIDVGGGLGGPAAWIGRRYLCHVTSMDPSEGACDGANRLFRLGVVRANAARMPFRTDSFDAVLMLGTLSVLGDASPALGEAARVADRLGVLDYCSNSATTVEAGSSRFLSHDDLVECVNAGGWLVGQHHSLTLPTPDSWSAAQHAAEPPENERQPSELEVIAAVERGAIAPVVLIAETARDC